MNKNCLYWFGVFFLLLGCGKDPYINIENPSTKDGWGLIFQEEFDTNSIDKQLWGDNSWSRSIVGNKELQYYTSPLDGDNYQIKNGIIKLIALKKNITSRVVDHWADDKIIYDGYPNKRFFTYSSGKLETSIEFLYGYFEIKCKIPKGKGLWPAFWLIATNTSDYKEIDIFEFHCDEPNVLHMTNHYLDGNGEKRIKAKHIKGPDFSKNFHTIGIEWDSRKIVWYFDNMRIFTSRKEIPHVGLRMIVNLAVGGEWPGHPNNDTQFPAALEVDYIRVFQKLY